MRSVGSELLSVVTVLAIPVGIAVVFPYCSIGFSASRRAPSAHERTAAIVFLDDQAVARAMRATRTVPRNGDVGRTYIDLLSRDLPESDDRPMASVGPRRHAATPPIVENGIPPFLPSRRAPAPVRISAEAEKDEPQFSRNELLKLN